MFAFFFGFRHEFSPGGYPGLFYMFVIMNHNSIVKPDITRTNPNMPIPIKSFISLSPFHSGYIPAICL